MGAMDDMGLLPGRMKFDGAGGGSKIDRFLPGRSGSEKSAISLFSSTPVEASRMPAPHWPFTVDVTDTAMRQLSTTHVWEVPRSSTCAYSWRRGRDELAGWP